MAVTPTATAAMAGGSDLRSKRQSGAAASKGAVRSEPARGETAPRPAGCPRRRSAVRGNDGDAGGNGFWRGRRRRRRRSSVPRRCCPGAGRRDEGFTVVVAAAAWIHPPPSIPLSRTRTLDRIGASSIGP
jgi:hypothetical protein